MNLRQYFYAAAACLFSCMATFANTNAKTFDGLSIIDLDDPAAVSAIHTGDATMPTGKVEYVKSYIAVFVSSAGKYASLLGKDGVVSCSAWGRSGTYSGTAIEFGFNPNKNRNHMPGRVCMPFRLELKENGNVRVVAKNRLNRFGLNIGDDLPLVGYDRERSFLLRLPLQSFDFANPAFATYAIHGIKLGPLNPTNVFGEPVRENVGRYVGPKHLDGKIYSGRIGELPGGRAKYIINGRVAPKENTGWPWDALFTTWRQSDTPDQTISPEKYWEERVAERGLPTHPTKEAFLKTPQKIYWLHDVSGKKLTTLDKESPCTKSFDRWREMPLAMGQRDFAPWGCAAVLTVDPKIGYAPELGPDGKPKQISTQDLLAGKPIGVPQVTQHRWESVAGYASSLHHFLVRINQIEETRKKWRELGQAIDAQ